MNHRRGHLFVPVQECEIDGRVSVGDVAPLVASSRSCAKAAGAGRASSKRGQCQVLGSEPISVTGLRRQHSQSKPPVQRPPTS